MLSGNIKRQEHVILNTTKIKSVVFLFFFLFLFFKAGVMNKLILFQYKPKRKKIH